MWRRPLQALAALTVAGAVLRFATLDLQSFWYDEAVTVGLVRRGFADMLRQIPASESTPPLYYVVAWVWARLFGHWEVGLRSLSAVVGTATIPAAYCAAAQLVSRRAALAVAALAAFNPLLIWYSQEARSYALVLLLTTIALCFFGRASQRPDGRVLALWALFSALALATHYFAVFVVLPEAAWLAWRHPGSRATLVAVAGACLAALAVLPLALHQRGLGLTSFIADSSLARRLPQVPKQYLVAFDFPAERIVPVVAAAPVAAGIWLALRGDTRERRGARLAAGLAATAVGVPLLLAVTGTDYFQSRNLIVAWVPFAVVLATGLTSRRAGRVGLLAVAGLCALGLINFAGLLTEPSWRRDDWRGIVKAVGVVGVPTVVVGTPEGGEVPFRLYRPDAIPPRQPAATASVREVVLVSRPAHSADADSPATPPHPGQVKIPGFTEVQRSFHTTYTLVRLVSPRPVQIALPTLKLNRLLPASQPFFLFLRPR